MVFKKDNLKVSVILVVFWCLFVLLYKLESPYYLLMERVIIVKNMSEWNLLEQLSKYYLFVVMLVSIISYNHQKQIYKIKLSIGFLLIGLVMYLSESNMITNTAQPVFGIVIFGYIFYFLFKYRSWLTVSLIFLGLATILLGWVIDYTTENEWVYDYFPQYALGYFNEKIREEGCDAIGLAFVCVSVIICFLDSLSAFFKENKLRYVLLVMVTSGMITVGNGFLHWQHHPNIKIKTFALVLTLLGFIGFILTNKYLLQKYRNLTMVDEEKQYLYMFFVFVVLPAVSGYQNTMISLVLWFPAFMFMGGYLFFRHPNVITDRLRQ